jgi:hypothetical protein
MKKGYSIGVARRKVHDTRCNVCGRTGLEMAKGSVRLLVWHYAPEPCGRPCVGGVVHQAKQGDAPNGFHLAAGCRNCGP